MIEYTVKVYANGDKEWYLNDKLHCEHGPAIDDADGDKGWCLNGKLLSKEEFNKRMNKSCSDKLVEIDGVKYNLVAV